MSFLNKILPKNKNLLLFGLIIIFVFLGVILPSPTSAGPITNALLLLPGIFMAFFGFITNLFAQLSILLFNWVTSPTFISWGYTQNPVIKLGLGITKQFVNMGLVVVLIFIALAIALRLQEYASQKTLIRLIAVALLVNFAPVICGLIVDAANIVMNYFLSAIKTGVNQILGGLGGSFQMFSDMLSITKPTAEQFGLFGRLGVFVIFNAVIGFTFILLAVIFIVRYLAIWVLVILAPLAFVAWILPATKKFWDQWWQQFLQWSIIGIPLAFFVYLAMNSFGAMQIEFGYKMPTPGLEKQLEPGVGFLNEYFGFMIVIIMIWLGIIIGLQTSAMGASGIMDFAKTKGKAGAKWAAKRIPAGTMAATAGAAKGLGKGFKEGWREGRPFGRIVGAGAALGGSLRGAFKGAATYEGREKGREVMGQMLEKAHLVRPGAYETARRKRWKIEEETKRLDTLPTDRLREIAQRMPLRPADRKGAIAAFEVLAKRSALGDKEKDLLPKMQSFGADTKQALKARPDWAPLVNKKTSEVVAGTSPRDFTKNTQVEALKNTNVIISMDTSKIRHIGAHGSSEQKKAISEGTLTVGSSVHNEISQKIKDLKKTGKKDEAKRIIKLIKEIESNPNLRP